MLWHQNSVRIIVMPMFQETQEHVSVALFCFSHHNTLLLELKVWIPQMMKRIHLDISYENSQSFEQWANYYTFLQMTKHGFFHSPLKEKYIFSVQFWNHCISSLSLMKPSISMDWPILAAHWPTSASTLFSFWCHLWPLRL